MQRFPPAPQRGDQTREVEGVSKNSALRGYSYRDFSPPPRGAKRERWRVFQKIRRCAAIYVKIFPRPPEGGTKRERWMVFQKLGAET